MKLDNDQRDSVVHYRLDEIDKVYKLRERAYRPAYRFYLAPWYKGVFIVAVACFVLYFLSSLHDVHFYVRFVMFFALVAYLEVNRLRERQDALIELYRMRENKDGASRCFGASDVTRPPSSEALREGARGNKMKKRIVIASAIGAFIAALLYPVPDLITQVIAGVVAFVILLGLLFCTFGIGAKTSRNSL